MMVSIDPMGSYHIPLSLIFIFILMIYCIVSTYTDNTDNTDYTDKRFKTVEMMSKNYYSVNEVCPDLIKIYHDIEAMRQEVTMIKNNTWAAWPEKELYDMSESRENRVQIFKPLTKKFEWNIFPFKAFDVEVKENCMRCPRLWAFLQQIPGLKIALLSRLGPGTKLNTHRGWGGHSNHVIRCHFGFKVPKGCYLSVKEKETDDEEIKLHKEGKWITFDDSRHHYAHNPTEEDRIVLIIDIQRPAHIKTGNSDIGDTKELLQIVNYFKQKNITVNDQANHLI